MSGEAGSAGGEGEIPHLAKARFGMTKGDERFLLRGLF